MSTLLCSPVQVVYGYSKLANAELSVYPRCSCYICWVKKKKKKSCYISLQVRFVGCRQYKVCSLPEYHRSTIDDIGLLMVFNLVLINLEFSTIFLWLIKRMNVWDCFCFPLLFLLFVFHCRAYGLMWTERQGLNGNHQSLLVQLCYWSCSPKQETTMNNSSQDTVRKNC